MIIKSKRNQRELPTKILLFIFSMICTTLSVVGQTQNVKGKIVDSEGKPIIAASVMIIGEKHIGDISNKDGEFSIKAKKDDKLEITAVGYLPQRVSVGDSYLQIVLEEKSLYLDEAIVVGYGTMKRKDLIGSVSSISGKEIEKVPVMDVTNALAGRLPGVQIISSSGAPGADVSIVIRGGGSITQSNEPLFVIDGFPQEDGLSLLDPANIENITVLKDAASTAIYGARGANGVILVTTKSGTKGEFRVNYDMYYGEKKITKEIPLLDPYEYVLLRYENSLRNETLKEPFKKIFGEYDTLKQLYQNRPGIDWQKEMFGGTVNNQYHKIGISGGKNSTKLNMFYASNDDNGIMVNSGEVRNIARLGINQKVSKRLSVSGNVTYTARQIYGTGTEESNGNFNKLTSILRYRPTIGKNGADEDLLYLDEDPALEDENNLVLQNPMVSAKAETRLKKISNLFLNASIDFKIFNNLTYRGVIGWKSASQQNKSFDGARSIGAKRSGGPFGSISQTNNQSWSFSNTLNFNKNYGKIHGLNVMLGQERSHSESDYFGVSSNMFPDDDIGLYNMSLGALPGIPTSGAETDDMVSFFGRANYSYKNKFILTTSFRADGSSKFGSDNKFGYFPSVAFAWRAIEEKFLKNSNTFSDLKLRLSFGQSGNNRISNYLSLALLESGNYPLNKAPVVSVGSRVLANPNLQWETTESFNAGIDIGILNERVTMTIDAYNNNVRNLLLDSDIPYSSGFSSMQINVGSTRNTGIEFSLNTINIKSKNLQWESNFNISFNKNKVTGLNNGQDFFLASSSFGGSRLNEADYIIRVGQPVGQMYGYQSSGLYQVDEFDFDPSTNTYTLKDGIPYDPNNIPQPGFLKLIDQDTSGFITPDDRVVIGNSMPKYFGGFNNTLRYRNFDLSVFVNWVYGNNIYNGNKLFNSQTTDNYNNVIKEAANRWTTIDDNGNLITNPDDLKKFNIDKKVPVYTSNQLSLLLYDHMIEDGSFLRINNISLGYTFPKKLISGVKMNSLRVYFTAYNVYTFTSYSGYDPEVQVKNNTRLTPGIDFGAYPRVRKFLLGANVSF